MPSKAPHPIGRHVRGELIGRRFKLVLEAEMWSSTSWAGSEYSERLETSHWYEGEASISRIAGKKPIACFLTSFGTEPEGGSLRDAILRTDKWGYSFRLPKSYLIPERISDLVDYVCERALAAYKKQLGTRVPQVSFRGVSHQELLLNGFMFDDNGQASLALVA